MADEIPSTALQPFSTVRGDRLVLTLRDVPVREPGDDEVLIRIEASPINPSDLAVMTGGADGGSFRSDGGDPASASGSIPEPFRRMMAPRDGRDLPVGNEGAGTVIAAGRSPDAQALVGRTVALAGGQFYSQYRVAKASDCLVVPDDVTAEDAASSFVNPMTALGFLTQMRRDGYKGLIHTAAASNLGQMLVKLCRDEGVPLVNIVRTDDQVALLRDLGAEHVVNVASSTFIPDLVEAIAATQAYLAFDATGGGKLANQILVAMEQASLRTHVARGPYGSNQMKQVYLFGGLQTGPTELTRGYGMKWAVGGWLVSYVLEAIGAEETAKLRRKVASELKTTFASRYTRRITLAEAIDPAVIAAYTRKATGEKYLITPHG